MTHAKRRSLEGCLLSLSLVAGALVLFGAACSPTEEPPPSAAVHADAGDAGDSSPSSGADGGADSGARCNDLTTEGLVPATFQVGAPSAPSGGALIDGSYDHVATLTADAQQEGVEDARLRRLTISGSTVQHVTNWDDRSGEDRTTTETWTVRDDVLTIRKTCPEVGEPTSLKLTVETADSGSGATRLLIHAPSGVLVYERR